VRKCGRSLALDLGAISSMTMRQGIARLDQAIARPRSRGTNYLPSLPI
jgi:hypothetical protein